MAGTEARDQHLRYLAAYDRLLAEQQRAVAEHIEWRGITERLAETPPEAGPEAEPEAGQ